MPDLKDCLDVDELLKPDERVFVICHNSEGRPCGWGIAGSLSAARAEAERQYKGHCCYPGERPGKTTVHVLAEGDV